VDQDLDRWNPVKPVAVLKGTGTGSSAKNAWRPYYCIENNAEIFAPNALSQQGAI